MSSGLGPSAGLSPAVAGRLRAALLAWYDRNRRSLPWRAEPGASPDPWAVLVSEVMLQQTTVATILGRYPAFLHRFPTAAAMAAAPLEEVMHAWQGLGYYRRARALHACAERIATMHDGRVPADGEALRALPGLGPYTARAVAAIAFGHAVVPVDANVTRVMIRLLGVPLPLDRLGPVVDAAATTLASPTRAGDLAQALMELGALVCRPRAPACGECPWQRDCVADRLGLARSLPVAAVKRPRRACWSVAYLLRRPDGRMLLERRPPSGLLGGMVTLPMSQLADGLLDGGAAYDPPGGVAVRSLPGLVRHVFTHIELEVRLVEGRTEQELPGIWAPEAALASLALPTLTRKLLRHAGIEVPAQLSGRQAS